MRGPIPPVADMFCLTSGEFGKTWICSINKLFDTNATEYLETYITPLLGSSTEFDVYVCCIDKDNSVILHGQYQHYRTHCML